MEITETEYFDLKRAELKLARLEAAGVDNWDWYGDALNPDGEESYDDAVEKLKAELFPQPPSNG